MTTPRSTRVGRPPGPAPDRDERRAALVDAAVRTIRRDGPRASMDAIAAEAGLSKPILYSSFGDKAGLVDAVADTVTADLVARIVSPLAATDGARDAVRSTIDAYLEFLEREPELYRFVVTERRPGGVPVAERTLAGVGDRVTDALTDAITRAGGDPSYAGLWACAILGTATLGGEWWLAHPEMDRDEALDRLTDLIWGGLQGAGLDSLTGPFLHE